MRTVDVGEHVYDVSVGEGAVWLLTGDDRDFYSVRRVDPHTLEVGAATPVGDPGTDVYDVTAGEGAVWVPLFGGPGRSQSAPGELLRIDPKTRRVIDRIAVGRHPLYAAAGGGKVWVANEVDRTISVVDPIEGRVSDQIQLAGYPGVVRFAEGAVWVTASHRSAEGDSALLRIDPTTHATDTVMSGRGIHAIADGAIWFSDKNGIGRYDIATRSESAERLSSDVEPAGVTAGEGTVWFARVYSEPPRTEGPPRLHGSFWKFHPRSFDRLTESVSMPEGDSFPRGWAVGMGALWAPAETNKDLLRVALEC